MDLSHITGNMAIGDDVFVSTMVGTTNDNAIGAEGYDEAAIQGPTLENGCAVGVGASLLPRVRVGEGALVGAGSVLTKSVPAHMLAIGAPARPVRSLRPDTSSDA